MNISVFFCVFSCVTEDCRNYYGRCLAPGMINHRSKLCDGNFECLDGSDESEHYCGTGCLTTIQHGQRFVNCGRKFIKIINAWNVPSDYDLKSYINSGQAINISNMFSHCSSQHKCDLYFTTGHKFAVVKFECEEFSSTTASTMDSSLQSILRNITMHNKYFSQTTPTKISINKEKQMFAFLSTSPSTMYYSLKEMLKTSTKQNKSFLLTTTSKISVLKENKKPVTYIIIGVLGGVVMCLLISLLLYKLRRHIVGVKQETARSIPKLNTIENVTYAEGHVPHTEVQNNDQIENVDEKEHELIEYATPNKMKDSLPKSDIEAEYICNSSETYDHLRVVYKNYQDEICGNIYDHSYGTKNEDEYDSIQR